MMSRNNVVACAIFVAFAAITVNSSRLYADACYVAVNYNCTDVITESYYGEL